MDKYRIGEQFLLISVVGLLVLLILAFFRKSWFPLLLYIAGITFFFVSRILEGGWMKNVVECPYIIIFIIPFFYSFTYFRIAFGDGVMDFFEEFRVKRKWLAFGFVLGLGYIVYAIPPLLKRTMTLNEELIALNIIGISWYLVYYPASKRLKRREDINKKKRKRREKYLELKIDEKKKDELIDDYTDRLVNGTGNLAENLFMRAEIYMVKLGLGNYQEKALNDFDHLINILSAHKDLDEQERKILELSYANKGEILFDRADKSGALANYSLAAKYTDNKQMYLEEIEQIKLFGIVYPFEEWRY